MPWQYGHSPQHRIKKAVKRFLLLGTLLVVFWVVIRAIQISMQGYF